MQIKKITFVLGGLVGGGAEKVASDLITNWVEKGYEITLITRLGPDSDFFTVPESVRRVVLGSEGESSNKLIALFRNIPFVRRLRKGIKSADSQIVISFLTKTNIHTLLALKGSRARIIISERNDTTRQDYPWPWPQLRKLLYKNATFVTANSEIALGGMKSYVPHEKLRVLPNPVVIPEQRAEPAASSRLLHVGRLVPQKRQDLLLDAFSLLGGPLREKWSCSFLGEGEVRESLTRQADQLGITRQVTFHGLVRNPSEYYLKAGVFVMPSDFEGTPNALLEAMAHGLPSVVADCLPGALQFIRDGENGLVFKAGDPDDLASKLSLLMMNPGLRNDMGKEAVKSVEHLTMDRISSEWEKLFHA